MKLKNVYRDGSPFVLRWHHGQAGSAGRLVGGQFIHPVEGQVARQLVIGQHFALDHAASQTKYVQP